MNLLEIKMKYLVLLLTIFLLCYVTLHAPFLWPVSVTHTPTNDYGKQELFS